MFQYFSHMLVYRLVALTISVIDKYAGVEILPYQFAVSLFVTLLIAVCIEWLSNKDKFKWLNRLPGN